MAAVLGNKEYIVVIDEDDAVTLYLEFDNIPEMRVALSILDVDIEDDTVKVYKRFHVRSNPND